MQARVVVALLTRGLHIRATSPGAKAYEEMSGRAITNCGLVWLNHGLEVEAAVDPKHWAARLACRQCRSTKFRPSRLAFRFS